MISAIQQSHGRFPKYEFGPIFREGSGYRHVDSCQSDRNQKLLWTVEFKNWCPNWPDSFRNASG